MNDTLLKILAQRLFPALVLALVCVASGAPARAADMPGEITLKDAPLTLKRAVRTALDNSRTVQSADLQVRSADSKIREVKSSFGFDLSIKSTVQRVEDSSVFSLPLTYYNVAPVTIGGAPLFAITDPTPQTMTVSSKLNAEWQQTGEMTLVKPLFTFGKRKAAVSAATHGSGIARLDAELARITLTARVTELFQGALLAAQAVAVQEQALERARAHLSNTTKRYESGLGVKLDLIRADTDVQKAMENLNTAQKNFTLVRKALSNALGLDYGRDIAVSDADAFQACDLKPLDYYLQTALEKRPELGQLDLGVKAAENQVSLNRDRPMVALAGLWNYRGRGSMFSSQDTWRAVLSVQAPVFDNGNASAKVAQARLRVRDLDLKSTDLKNGIQLQVEQAYLNVVEAGQRLDTSRSILDMAREGYRIADLSYGSGYATQLDVLDAAHGLTQAELNHARSQHDYEVAKSQLALACGLYTLE
jgi:outer membrane protein TolC